VAARYPGESEPVNESEYREAVRRAEEVKIWAENICEYG